MHIESAHLICYSPTRTTFTNLQHLAEGMGLSSPHTLDLTLPAASSGEEIVIEEGLALIGVPVYAGRVAPVAARRLKAIRGHNTPAVVVVVYGNRDFEGALVELKQLAEEAGFAVVAGAALVGEHSYSSPEKPIAAGRPDETDRHTAKKFGAAIMEKLREATDLSELRALEFPGTLPEGPYPGPANIAPETDTSLCTLCGLCADHCPTGAITVNETVTTDASLCTFCCACVKACPEGAVAITIPRVLKRVNLLYENVQARREPELFL